MHDLQESIASERNSMLAGATESNDGFNSIDLFTLETDSLQHASDLCYEFWKKYDPIIAQQVLGVVTTLETSDFPIRSSGGEILSRIFINPDKTQHLSKKAELVILAIMTEKNQLSSTINNSLQKSYLPVKALGVIEQLGWYTF